jgi:hypothetical protein
MNFGCSDGEAFTSGNWEWQEKMMDALCTGLDRCLVGFKFVQFAFQGLSRVDRVHF